MTTETIRVTPAEKLGPVLSGRFEAEELRAQSMSSRCRAPYPLGMELHVVFEPDEEGWVRASIEELPGVITCAPRATKRASSSAMRSTSGSPR